MTYQGTDETRQKNPKFLGPKSKRHETGDETKPKNPKLLGPKSKRHETDETKSKTPKLLGPKSKRHEEANDDSTKEPNIQQILGPKSKRKIKITSTNENLSVESNNYQESEQKTDDILASDLESEFIILSEEIVNSLSCPVCFEIPKYDASIKANLDDPTLLPLSGFVLDEFAIFHH